MEEKQASILFSREDEILFRVADTYHDFFVGNARGLNNSYDSETRKKVVERTLKKVKELFNGFKIETDKYGDFVQALYKYVYEKETKYQNKFKITGSNVIRISNIESDVVSFFEKLYPTTFLSLTPSSGKPLAAAKSNVKKKIVLTSDLLNPTGLGKTARTYEFRHNKRLSTADLGQVRTNLLKWFLYTDDISEINRSFNVLCDGEPKGFVDDLFTQDANPLHYAVTWAGLWDSAHVLGAKTRQNSPYVGIASERQDNLQDIFTLTGINVIKDIPKSTTDRDKIFTIKLEMPKKTGDGIKELTYNNRNNNSGYSVNDLSMLMRVFANQTDLDAILYLSNWETYRESYFVKQKSNLTPSERLEHANYFTELKEHGMAQLLNGLTFNECIDLCLDIKASGDGCQVQFNYDYKKSSFNKENPLPFLSTVDELCSLHARSREVNVIFSHVSSPVTIHDIFRGLPGKEETPQMKAVRKVLFEIDQLLNSINPYVSFANSLLISKENLSTIVDNAVEEFNLYNTKMKYPLQLISYLKIQDTKVFLENLVKQANDVSNIPKELETVISNTVKTLKNNVSIANTTKIVISVKPDINDTTLLELSVKLEQLRTELNDFIETNNIKHSNLIETSKSIGFQQYLNGNFEFKQLKSHFLLPDTMFASSLFNYKGKPNIYDLQTAVNKKNTKTVNKLVDEFLDTLYNESTLLKIKIVEESEGGSLNQKISNLLLNQKISNLLLNKTSMENERTTGGGKSVSPSSSPTRSLPTGETTEITHDTIRDLFSLQPPKPRLVSTNQFVSSVIADVESSLNTTEMKNALNKKCKESFALSTHCVLLDATILYLKLMMNYSDILVFENRDGLNHLPIDLGSVVNAKKIGGRRYTHKKKRNIV